jgi:hypothetical protein
VSILLLRLLCVRVWLSFRYVHIGSLYQYKTSCCVCVVCCVSYIVNFGTGTFILRSYELVWKLATLLNFTITPSATECYGGLLCIWNKSYSTPEIVLSCHCLPVLSEPSGIFVLSAQCNKCTIQKPLITCHGVAVEMCVQLIGCSQEVQVFCHVTHCLCAVSQARAGACHTLSYQ